jgi:UDP-N-acetylmuramoylalanine--D-glutamate ligase
MAVVPKKYKDYPTDAFLVTYESSEELAKYFDIDISKIDIKEPFLLDALLALSVTKALYDEVDYALINSYSTDPHKLEEFRDSKDRLWVDDSKATNVMATIEALKRYRDSKIYIILGGDDKEADLTPLYKALKELDVRVYTIGKNAQKLYDNIVVFNPNTTICNTLDKAVKAIDSDFSDGVALLSPSCASLDQFNSYKHRGQEFKLYVNKI